MYINLWLTAPKGADGKEEEEEEENQFLCCILIYKESDGNAVSIGNIYDSPV